MGHQVKMESGTQIRSTESPTQDRNIYHILFIRTLFCHISSEKYICWWIEGSPGGLVMRRLCLGGIPRGVSQGAGRSSLLAGGLIMRCLCVGRLTEARVPGQAQEGRPCWLAGWSCGPRVRCQTHCHIPNNLGKSQKSQGHIWSLTNPRVYAITRIWSSPLTSSRENTHT